MSLSQPKLTNPCKKFVDYSGDSGTFFRYNKETEKKEPIPVPLYFVVLDELSTITGFNEKHSCGIFANEVHSTTNEILRVKTFKGGESIIGKYADIKDAVKAIGGKYTKSVYAMQIVKGIIPELVNFKFKGSALNGWLDKKFNVYDYVIGVLEFSTETKGKTVYKVPVFKSFKMSEEILEQAKLLDVTLQDYLREYKSQIPEAEVVKAELADEEPEREVWHGKDMSKSDIGGKLTKVEEEEELPF